MVVPSAAVEVAEVGGDVGEVGDVGEEAGDFYVGVFAGEGGGGRA